MDNEIIESSSSHYLDDFGFRQKTSSRSIDMNGSAGIHADVSDSHEHQHALQEDMPYEDEEDAFKSPRRQRQRSQTSSTQVQRTRMEMKKMLERLKMLESRLPQTLNNDFLGRLHLLDTEEQDEENCEVPESGEALNGIEYSPSHFPSIAPCLLEKSWSDFMNKQVSGDSDSDSAIEILKGYPPYYNPSVNEERQAKLETNGTAKEASAVADCVKRTLQTTSTLPDDKASMPDRIRINSPFILSALSGIDKDFDSSGPVVMLRPYKFLVYHSERIREAAQVLCRNAEEQPDSADAGTIRTTLAHVYCLLDFYDTYVGPTVDSLRVGTATKIQFRDLWYIFNPGEDIYMPLRRLRQGSVSHNAMDATPETFVRRYNMLWRVVGAGCGRPNISAPQSHDTSLKPAPFKIKCYYVDFDGKFFIPTIHEFALLPFNGECEITSLDFYPVRFMKDAQRSLLVHTEQGKKTFAAIAAGFTHFYYAGLTMVTQPCGCALKGCQHQEYVESEVVVDFKAALLRHPEWRPRVTLWKSPPKNDGEVHERRPVKFWKDSARNHLDNSLHDYIYDDSRIDRERSIIFRNQEQIFSPIPSGWASNAEMVPQKDVGLLAGRAFGFVLRTRCFAPLWLWALQPIEKSAHSLENLQLRKDSFKETIYALVESHFRQMSQHSADIEYDIVKGKGKGLIILLHGAPGVGKTSTAESVAAKSGRPLFQITSGDLGLSPGEVEKNLKEIFRFAQLWGCILLLDECDIFLAQRAKNDIKHNGLVSVFLRTLEFFSGVLFLTTNRVGVLDDAIKSRLTWTAYYPPLDESQTMRIWKVNLRLLRERNTNIEIDARDILKFALKHFRGTESTWNGRQIQTAFKVATALAEWDLHSHNEQLHHDIGSLDDIRQLKPRLTAAHFEIIAQGTQDFEDYMLVATGLTARERAWNAMERADEFEDLVKFENPTRDEYSHHQQPRRMSASFVQQAHERIPGSPHALSPVKGRRPSNLKYQPNISPSASVGNLVPVVHEQVRRRQSSTLSTVMPLTEVRGHSPQMMARHTKPSHNSHSKHGDLIRSREIPQEGEYDIDLSEFDDKNDAEIDDTKSSLGGYGSDLT